MKYNLYGQKDVEKCRKDLEQLTVLVSKLGLFSDNEDIEELATSSIKFLLLPAMLGNITCKRRCKPFVLQNPAASNTNGTASSTSEDDLPMRKTILSLGKDYFEDFITRCRDYGVTSAQIPQKKESGSGLPAPSGKPTPQVGSLSLQYIRFSWNSAHCLIHKEAYI